MNALKTVPNLWLRNMRQFPRMPSVLVFGIVAPIVQLLLFGNIFSATTQIPGNPYAHVVYMSYIAPAIILLTTFMGMANASVGLIVDLKNGYFDKLRTTPAGPVAIVGSRLLADLTRVMGQGFIVLAVALLAGASVATGPVGAIALVVLAAVFSAATVGLFITALAMATKSDEATFSIFPLFFIAIFLTTAFMPKQLMPAWLQTAVTYNPVEYLVQALRSLMLDGWPWGEIQVTLVAVLVVGALLALLNRAVYHRMVRGA